MFVKRFLILFVLSAVNCEVIKLSCDKIKQLVDGHNMRRLKVARGEVPHQPPAARMNYVVWDEELAKKATDWVARDRFKHNPDRSIPSKRFTTGENIYKYSTTAWNPQFDLDKGIESWFEEYKLYNYGVFDPKLAVKDIGHYTQMIWANTIYIGCGVSKYKVDRWTTFLLVCNYGPTGNYIGAYPYLNNGSPARSLVCYKNACKKPYGSQC